MRKILMVGTHLAQPPYAPAARVWVDELTAYALAKITPTPEITYVNARDTISDAHGAHLMARMAAENAQLWADRIGPVMAPGPANFVTPVPDSEPNTTRELLQPRWPQRGY